MGLLFDFLLSILQEFVLGAFSLIGACLRWLVNRFVFRQKKPFLDYTDDFTYNLFVFCALFVLLLVLF